MRQQRAGTRTGSTSLKAGFPGRNPYRWRLFTLPRSNLSPERLAVILLVVGTHVALLNLLSQHRTLQILATAPSNPIFLSRPPDAPASRSADQTSQTREAIVTRPVEVTPTPPKETVAEPLPDEAPRPIDWASEAERVAADLIEAAETQPRPRHFGERDQSEAADTAGKARDTNFGWAPWRINRIQITESGATLFWLNERCALVNFLLPMCLIGEIEPNGDLFKNMRPAPELGDWKE